MGQLKKFIAKDITIALKPLKLETKASHEVLHARLDGFEIRLGALERSGPSSDIWSLQIELQELREVVQELQACDQVTLDDPNLTTLVDLAKFFHVENLIEDDDSPIATPSYNREKGKGMR
ncbi:hypothetical protein K7X08_026313 [Anisodus acutangulus]|uniref:Uncharacterized protein n=1 Tax=Anisodus acutangulus TaxID=402998 RepID=A0A9Q1LNM7_9SOLA|nr:hypothetical protein K7X08_026313 [Anisodus acutangulus]